MNLSLREREILKLANQSGSVTVDELASKFEVTVQTIRRDLSTLAEAGLLERVHGGAALPSGIRNIAYSERRQLNATAKNAIAHSAAREIPNGSALFLGIGTTTEALAHALVDHEALFVVTNNLNVAETLAARSRCEVLITGGKPRQEDGGVTGTIAANMLANFRFDLAIAGCSAIASNGFVFDYDIEEVTVSKAAFANSKASWLLADQSKFSRQAPIRATDMSTLNRFFTTGLPAECAPFTSGWRAEIIECS